MPRPSGDERRRLALDRLRASGYVASAELAAELSVSEMTIRRDFRALEADGLGRRVTGGLGLPEQEGWERQPFVVRIDTARAEKAALAEAALAHLPATGTIALDAGSTVLPLASRLPGGLLCLTPSLPVAEICAGRDDVRLLSTGGDYAPETESFVGPLTRSALEGLAADVAVLGAASVGPGGLFSATTADAEIKGAMIAAARQVLVVVDASKLDRGAPVRYARLAQIDRLLVSRPAGGELPPWLLEDPEELGCVVEIVDVPR